ncbi:serine hydrolase [Actinocatenispora comari]|uniref:Serine hydrolase n=1 Tax=Actinocatenispora comari TaxID=2807577 RepID=A0A8J4AEF7_9ACTN|nr:serine hydrolase [Actinocatenispora comari]GIL29834.1 serine hydrolase [Actinocatenispora comari]
MAGRPSIDDLYATALPEQPAAAPDGSIAYVLRTVRRDADRDRRTLWLVRPGQPARQLTFGESDGAPVFSPDGSRLAFLRAADGPAQVWLLPVAGGEAEQLTSLPLGAGTPVWSPDGTRIAFGAPIDLHAVPGEDTEATAARQRAPIVTDRLDGKADGAGLLRTLRTHVHVVDVATREVRRVTGGDWHAGDPAWSPDGTRLAFPAARDADADLTLRIGAYLVDAVARNAKPVLVGGADWQLGTVGFTPAGDALLAVGRTDTRAGNAGLLRIPLEGGEPLNLAGPLDRNVMPGGPGYPGALPQPTADHTGVLFCVRDNGSTHLYEVPLAGGAPRLLVGGDRNVAGVSAVGDTVAFVVGTSTSYGEVGTVDRATGEITVHTEHCPADAVRYPREEREFTAPDGTVLHGWLVRDRERSGPLPLLLDIHGGPHNAWNGAADPAHLYHQVLADRGWAVLLLNPRGSDGYGEAFLTAAIGAWGEADAADFLSPIDDLVAEGLADPDRLAVTGYSYGGYMTCYLTSRDQRFAAAVAGGVVADLTSMTGTSDLGYYLAAAELSGVPWQDADRYARLSPLTRVQDVRTPTLLVQGENDDRCPVGQAEQWFGALRARGVPTRLVRYPDESHLFILDGAPSHRADWNRRVVDWVERYAAPPARRGRPALDAAHWQRRLTELAAAHKVPGATLGILRLGEDPVVAHHGVTSVATGVEVRDDTLFQIGSISKVWTATVVMQLVDEGKLELDAPVAEVLPELRLGDPEVAKQVTMRQLLTHTSGVDGDVFTDTGRGDDCVARYVEELAAVGQNHPLGVTFSYCNAGFVLAGRVIEKLTGQTWDQALRERLFAPLGLAHTTTLPEEALLFRAAVGHVAEGDADPQPAPVWGLPRSMGPAGLITASAADVLAFAAMHLSGGLAADGTRVLGERCAAAMTEHQTDVPDPYPLGDSWGLGWIRFGWDGHRLIGHDGNTIGQSAFLRLLPEQGVAVTLLTNGGNTRDLYEDLYREIFAELAGVAMPAPFAPPARPPSYDPGRHVGVYERASARLEVFRADGELRLRHTVTGPLAELAADQTEEYPLVPVTEDLFALRAPGTQTWMSAVFYRLPSGEPYLHFGARATPKVSG